MKNVTNQPTRLTSISITQEQALNLAASIASDFSNAVDLMPEDFKQRHHELFHLLLAQLPEEDKAHVLQCMPDIGATELPSRKGAPFSRLPYQGEQK